MPTVCPSPHAFGGPNPRFLNDFHQLRRGGFISPHACIRWPNTRFVKDFPSTSKQLLHESPRVNFVTQSKICRRLPTSFENLPLNSRSRWPDSRFVKDFPSASMQWLYHTCIPWPNPRFVFPVWAQNSSTNYTSVTFKMKKDILKSIFFLEGKEVSIARELVPQSYRSS